jgi:SAM-dependent methyltransferase
MNWTHLIPAQGTVLDVACGQGRHVHWLRAQGFALTAVDRDGAALACIGDLAPDVERVQADIENGPWPFTGRAFGGVVVTHYLWRPRLPDITAAVAPGGALLYETFAQGNETVGKPARPDFLLAPGELLATAAAAGLRVIAYEDGFLDAPARFVQRIAAIRPPVEYRPNLTPMKRPPWSN